MLLVGSQPGVHFLISQLRATLVIGGVAVTEVEQAILQAIERLNTRFDSTDDRLSVLESRLSALDGRMGSMESRLASVDGRMSSIEGRMSTIETVVADLNFQIKTWPDMHFLAAAAKQQMEYSREMKADVADIKARMAEIYQSMATDAEINSLRDEVARFRDQSVTSKYALVRLKAISVSKQRRRRAEAKHYPVDLPAAREDIK
jgi:chromosome segregation ATPase